MIQISVNQKGARAETIKQLVEAAIKTKYPDASIHVARKEPAESRADRFSEAQGLAADAKETGEALRDELQEWRDGLPENLQSGQKADDLDTAISELESFIEALETAENSSVEFPQMMG